MGSLPASLIGAHVAHGETIARATPADHLIVAGVSNWGAYALIGALAVIRDDWRATMIGCLDSRRATVQFCRRWWMTVRRWTA